MTSLPLRPDIVDRAAGLAGDASRMRIRDARVEYIHGAEACRLSVLEPEDDLGLDRNLRMAVARRVVLGTNLPDLLAEYPLPGEPEFRQMATGAMPVDAVQAAIARHVDMIAREPARACDGDLQTLLAAGLTVPEVVALSELVAFVCFQAQVVAGLALLGASL